MSGKRPKKARLANEGHGKPEVKSLVDLPDIPILRITSFLDGKDLLNFTHSCRHFYYKCDRSKKVWQGLYSLSFPLYKEIANAASKLVADKASAGTTNSDKLAYFMHVKTRQNWTRGRFIRRVNSRDGNSIYPKTRSREGVGRLNLIQDGPSEHFVFRFWDVKSGTDKQFYFNAPLAVKMMIDGRKQISGSVTDGSILILGLSSSSAIDFVALKLDDTNLEVRCILNVLLLISFSFTLHCTLSSSVIFQQPSLIPKVKPMG